jgi:hypothetical protein
MYWFKWDMQFFYITFFCVCQLDFEIESLLRSPERGIIFDSKYCPFDYFISFGFKMLYFEFLSSFPNN